MPESMKTTGVISKGHGTHLTKDLYLEHKALKIQQLKKTPNSSLKMDKRREQTFHQRGYKDGKKAHEKIINITRHQGNTN